MKERALIYLSLGLSVAALGYAAWVHKYAEEAAIQTMRRRERGLVMGLAPKVQTLCRDMLGKTNVFATEPTTLEELIRPLETIMESIGDGTELESPR